jgi:hypothetical protein
LEAFRRANLAASEASITAYSAKSDADSAKSDAEYQAGRVSEMASQWEAVKVELNKLER